MVYKCMICAPIWQYAFCDCGFHIPMTCIGNVYEPILMSWLTFSCVCTMPDVSP